MKDDSLSIREAFALGNFMKMNGRHIMNLNVDNHIVLNLEH